MALVKALFFGFKACNVGSQKKEKKNNKAQRGSTKGKINYKVGYLAYVTYNKEGLNHVHACMCQYDLEENQGKF